MQITNTSITAEDTPDPFWKFTIRYTAVFHPSEANFEFEDKVKIREQDTGGDHDNIGDWGPAHPFRPNGATSVNRTITTKRSRDALDTELGAEEIRAEIGLHNRTTNGPWISVHTSVVSIGV